MMTVLSLLKSSARFLSKGIRNGRPDMTANRNGGLGRVAGGLTFTQSQLGLVLLANRCEPASTELFLRVTAQILPGQLYTPLHASRGPRIGFLHFTLASTEEVGASRQERTNYLDCSRQIVHAQVQ